MKVAIIGAGMAGLTVATNLNRAGIEVTIFDKSKGTGGRMASRSYNDGWIDHGAPYFDAESPDFQNFLTKFVGRRVIQPWNAKINGLPASDEKIHHIAIPRSSALTRAMMGVMEFHPSTHIAKIERHGSQWQLYNDGGCSLGLWDRVISAIPAPQAAQLLNNQNDFLRQIEKAIMEPCWVCAIQMPHTVGKAKDVTIFPTGDIRRITYNSHKVGRNNKQIYVVQASAEWSKANLEQMPTTVGTMLKESFLNAFDIASAAEVLFTHRWRYAFTEKPLNQAYLWDQEQQLGVCGDWCLGRRVEDAWRSGDALAAAILTTH